MVFGNTEPSPTRTHFSSSLGVTLDFIFDKQTQHLVRSINARLSLGCAPFGHAPPAASQSASGQADEGLPYTLQPRLRAHSVIGAEVPCGCTGDPWWWCLSRTV
uniref:Uncharacterized protein n=1 Tax=Knipowitschia caucasica TaxID=637954 RepID=A0AAV2MD99_KNICA